MPAGLARRFGELRRQCGDGLVARAVQEPRQDSGYSGTDPLGLDPPEAMFDRSNLRQVRLTPVGRQLPDDLLPVYAGLRESPERAPASNAPLASRGINARLRVGMLPYNVHDRHPYWRAFRDRHPQWELQLRRTLSSTRSPGSATATWTY